MKKIAASIERTPRYWTAAVMALYFAGTLAKSHQKPLWFDELFTEAITRAGGLRQVSADLSNTGVGPLHFVLIQWSQRLFGDSDYATRFPSVLGMALLCICLYSFVRRRCGPAWGLCAMTLPLATGAYWYATEARAYALVLGFTGLALLSWASAAEGRRRPLALIGLAVSLAAAICCHCYAVQAVFAVGVGEAVRTAVRRKLDLAVWAALVIGAAPLLVLFPLAQSTSAALVASIQTGTQFAFRPHVWDPVVWYIPLLAPAIGPLLAALVLAAVIRRPAPAKVEAYPVSDFGAIAGFLMLPVVMVIGTKLTTNCFMWRYALPTLVGVVLLMVYGVRRVVKGSTTVAVLWLAANAGLVAAKGVRNAWIGPAPAGLSAAMPGFPATDTLPIVIANPLIFLEALRYSPPEVVPRLHYLTNRAAVMDLPDFIPELMLIIARSWAPFPVEDYSAFNKREHSYWIYSTNNPDLEWLPELRAPHGANSFLLVAR